MRVVAVDAAHALLRHLALQERTPDVDLLALLTIGVIVRRGRAVARRWVSASGVPGWWRSASAERRAWQAEQLFCAAGSAGMVALRIARVGSGEGPGLLPAALDRRRKALVAQALVARLGPGPRDVARALPVAGLARDVDLLPCRLVAGGGGVVALDQLGRVALGALQVPVLVQASPVQRVLGVDLLLGVEVEPALPARGLGPAVPGDGERLQPATGKRDQVLLQRRRRRRCT